MAKELLNIGLQIEYDADENDGIPASTFLYRLLNRINYENPVKSVRIKSKQRDFGNPDELKDLELREQDKVEIQGVTYKEI